MLDFDDSIAATSNDLYMSTVVLKGKYQKKNVSDSPSMDSFNKIYFDLKSFNPKSESSLS